MLQRQMKQLLKDLDESRKKAGAWCTTEEAITAGLDAEVIGYSPPRNSQNGCRRLLVVYVGMMIALLVD